MTTVVWITGRAATGKSTLLAACRARLRAAGHQPLCLCDEELFQLRRADAHHAHHYHPDPHDKRCFLFRDGELFDEGLRRISATALAAVQADAPALVLVELARGTAQTRPPVDLTWRRALDLIDPASPDQPTPRETDAMSNTPHRQHPPRRRIGRTFTFTLLDCRGYVTVNEFDDGRVGEVFITVAKQGSTLAGLCDALAVAVSLGLQHGVPLALFVRHLAHTRFAPAGRTDDPQLPTATSLVDYVFQRLALAYLPEQDRAEVRSAEIRTRAVEAGLRALAGTSTLADVVVPHVAGGLGVGVTASTLSSR